MTGTLHVIQGIDVPDTTEVCVKHYTEAISLFSKIILGKWDSRFSQVEITALMEMNRMANYITFYGLQHQLLNLCDKQFLSSMHVDLRLCIMWDTDMTDVELEVLEPSGERCTTFHNKTTSGGMLSRNFSHGYGPMEYLLRHAQPGYYKIYVKLFSSMNKYTGTTVLLWVYTHFGDPNKEELQLSTFRLEKDREERHVAEVYFY